MDEAAGWLLDALDELRFAQDTIVIFFSDNGGIHFHNIEGAPVTSNAPLRDGKAAIYEGGARQSGQVISSIDFYPTLLEMTGLRPRPGQKFDGISIAPALRGGRLSRDAIFCHHPHYTPATGHRASSPEGRPGRDPGPRPPVSRRRSGN